VIDALTTGPTEGWGSPRVLVGLVLGAVCLAALVPVERRVRAPMLQLSLFASRQFSAINAATVVYYGALAAAGYLVVLWCQLVLGYSATRAGAVLIPSSVVFLALSPVSGALARRYGPRWLMTAGILATGAGFAWLGAAGPGPYVATILPGVLLWGVGLGLTVTPLTAAVLAAVDDEDLGEASAVSDVAARLGGAVLVALVPALIGLRAGGDLGAAVVDGYRPAMLVLAALCGVAALISAVLVSDARPDERAAALPRFAPLAPCRGCALPDPVAGTARATTGP
jgi:predicted MFS family arabinose efflux permease